MVSRAGDLPSHVLEQLAHSARSVQQHAYAPASRFRVGAAVLADDGRIFSGCNVENASYGLTICAERAAVFTAVDTPTLFGTNATVGADDPALSANETVFITIAVASLPASGTLIVDLFYSYPN